MKTKEINSLDLSDGISLIVDTSILNHIFSNNVDIGEEILVFLELYKDRIWIPHTVYKEFSELNTDKVIKSSASEYKKAGSFLKEKVKTLYAELDGKFMYIKNKKFELWGIIENEVKSKIKEVENLIESQSIDLSQYQDRMNKLIERTQKFIKEQFANGHVGKEFSTQEIIEICEEGAVRYDCLIPPGFSDMGKKGQSKYHDLFIWKEILQYAESVEEGSIIFLTDDMKEENWWSSKQDEKGEKVIHEFLKREFLDKNFSSENKKMVDIRFMTLIQFWEEFKFSYDIETCLKLEENKQIKKLINIHEKNICDKLYSYVVCMDYSELSDEFYTSNDTEVFYDDLEIKSHSVELLNQDLIHRVVVMLPFDLVIANEDNEGDRFVYGEAELMVTAIIEFKQKYFQNNEFGSYTIITKLNANKSDISIDNIGYEVISVTDPYDYYKD